jgi:hypothetical protein
VAVSGIRNFQEDGMAPSTIQVVQKTVDAQTGDVVDVKAVDFHILPPTGDCCQVCGKQHEPSMPHDCQSLVYQFQFRGAQGRWPTWEDAAAHCEAVVREALMDVVESIGWTWTAPEAGQEAIAHLGTPQPIKKG